ncbi:hypothetical protein NEOLEDRAFT_1127040 [Neolentinus lepideus HHB14362 ss-1]|uniref:Uncharacterized protein n=1 Tax=Neolentinus lepideus HHB14362 ss-1 TaxID=1314782 RepID=A0A165VTL0_9AGAM|nr:hypothetical protein NEOLEDRAFT_1127040 [Neolentinus lepideus HHB14362 ss-1]
MVANNNKPNGLQRTTTFRRLEDAMGPVESHDTAAVASSSATSATLPPHQSAETNGRGFTAPLGRELIRTTRSLLLPPLPSARTSPSSSHSTTNQLPYYGDSPAEVGEEPLSPTGTEPLGYDPCPLTQAEIIEMVKGMGIKVRDFEYENEWRDRRSGTNVNGKGKEKEQAKVAEGSQSRKRVREEVEGMSTGTDVSNTANGEKSRSRSVSTESDTSPNNATYPSLVIEEGSIYKRRKVAHTYSPPTSPSNLVSQVITRSKGKRKPQVNISEEVLSRKRDMENNSHTTRNGKAKQKTQANGVGLRSKKRGRDDDVQTPSSTAFAQKRCKLTNAPQGIANPGASSRNDQATTTRTSRHNVLPQVAQAIGSKKIKPVERPMSTHPMRLRDLPCRVPFHRTQQKR